jgi:hypothetical protein
MRGLAREGIPLYQIREKSQRAFHVERFEVCDRDNFEREAGRQRIFPRGTKILRDYEFRLVSRGT